MPILVSSRKPTERNQINLFDSMAIAAVSFEARANQQWAMGLTAADATTAAQLATLELNGFPSWTMALVERWPDAVRTVFLHEAEDHIAMGADHHGFIDKVGYADPRLAMLLAPGMTDFIMQNPDLDAGELSKTLEILRRALPTITPPPSFVRTALERFWSAERTDIAAAYLGLVFHVDATAAVDTLTKKLDTLDFPAQKLFVEYILPSVFGNRMFRTGIHPKVLPFDVLERLVSIAYRTVRFEDDNVHHGVFTPDRRDDAEDVRGNLLHQVLQTPGLRTIDALKRLGQDASVPIPRDRLVRMILERASEDAEYERWPAGEAKHMEEQFDVVPQTPQDLQRVALLRLMDIDHDVHHAEFAQGQTLKALPNEPEVQKWVANELRHRQGRAYTLTRESHVVDEKEPDIRFQSNMTTAMLPIEIKVAESWPLHELKAAITTQLAGRYLRERDQGHGILLVVHQKRRPKGWDDGTGRFLEFAKVVAILKTEAENLAHRDTNPAFVKVAVIDVSDVKLSRFPGR